LYLSTAPPIIYNNSQAGFYQLDHIAKMPLYLFNGLSPPNVFNNNPAFAAVLQTAPAASSLAALASDLTGGKSVVELTSAMVLTNILSKLKLGSSRTYTIIKVVGPCLILAGGAYEFAKRLTFIPDFFSAAYAKIAGCVTASIVVPADSALNEDVCSWVVAQGLGKNAKSLTLTPAYGQDSDDSDDEDDESGSAKRSKTPLNYMPSYGQSTFRYKGHRMTLLRKEATTVEDADGKFTKVEAGEADPTKTQNITISCFPTFRGTEPIKEFLEHVRGFSTPVREKVTQVFRPGGDHPHWWWDSCFRPARALEGVVMQSAVKNSLVADIEFYLSSECRKFYENRGIPYRRGYLLYGPPGTGKTSFATSVASHFNMPIYVLNLTGLDDKSLAGLFHQMPRRCILLLEDVDSAGLDRENDEPEEIADDKSSDGFNLAFSSKSKKRKVTLSGLLNALDGPASVDGRLLCMTSNSPDSLDAALVRPGRCDRKILFGYVCPEVSAKLFTNIYTKTSDELWKGEENVADVHDIPAMAAQFARKIPVDAAITPAECQAWLLANRLDPVAALEGASHWANEIIENKLRGANVASFTNEIKKGMPALRRLDTPPTSPVPSRASCGDADLKDFGD
jgi:chaperone BCS1